MNEPTVVPRAVLVGIEGVRRSGRVNMLDRPRVEQVAHELGFHAAVLWIHDHPGHYARGVFHGFRAEPDADHERHGASNA